MLLLSTFVCCVAAATTTLVSNATAPNHYAGTWNLTELTVAFRNGTVVQPTGVHPYGRLVLTPGFCFISQFNGGDYASHPFHPFPQVYVPGTKAQNAAVVRNSLALSGTYKVNEKGGYLGLATSGATIPNFIDREVKPPNSTFQLMKGNQKMIETLTGGDGSVVEYHWSRVETL